MAYALLNGTRYRGELEPLEPNANRPLPSRPAPEPWVPFQPTKSKRNECERINPPSMENISSAIPTIQRNSENSADLWFSTYENLPSIMDPTSPFINAFPINDTVVSPSPHSLINVESHYVNIPPMIYLSSTTYSYSYSDTLLPTFSNFLFPSSEQIASDIIHFLVQASPHSSPNNLQSVVLENVINKHYKQSLISDIDLLLIAFSNRNYTTFESIICSCIAHFGVS